ncbi:MAG: flagellar protein FlaG [Pseudomonadota bacterium]
MEVYSVNVPSLTSNQGAQSGTKEPTSVSKSKNTTPKPENEVKQVKQDETSGVSVKDEVVEFKAEVIEKVVENINKYLESTDNRLSFNVDGPSGRIAVKIINNVSGEVLREIPPEQILKLAAKTKEIIGLLFNEQA